MLEKGTRLLERDNTVEFRSLTAAELGELREDEPHPVAALAAGFQLCKSGVENSFLGFDETLEIVRVAHIAIMALWPPAEKGGSRSYCRGASSPVTT